MCPDNPLPIHAVLSELKQCLRESDQLILEAEPGAGKTSIVPLELINESWLAGQKILLLEPRRLAAKAAAARLSRALGEPVGRRVGQRLRLDNRVSEESQIEVMTEGVLIQQILSDPELKRIGMVIFDEFHERSVQADLALLLTQEVQQLRETPLKILIMSATLDTESLASHLKGCPIVRSEGRSFPVQIHPHPVPLRIQEILPALVNKIVAVVTRTQGDVLVFLPGISEINRVHLMLSESEINPKIQVLKLHGSMDLNEQQAVILPENQGQRIILATSIAQTSITLPRVTVVIDSGLERKAEFNPKTGITQLVTQRISAATAKQRAGRAGRLQAGAAYQLWPESQQLRPYDTAEILTADLSATLIKLLHWGIDQPEQADWLDSPAKSHWTSATELLTNLNLVKQSNEKPKLTDLGSELSDLPLEPELACLLHRSSQLGIAETGALLCAFLSENTRSEQTDLVRMLPELRSHTRFSSTRELARQFLQLLPKNKQVSTELNQGDESMLGSLLLNVFPKRLAKRSSGERYRLTSGTALQLPTESPLCSFEWVLALNLGGRKESKDLQLRLGLGVNTRLVEAELKHWVRSTVNLRWDKRSGKPLLYETRQIGSLDLEAGTPVELTPERRYEGLLSFIQENGIQELDAYTRLEPWLARVNYLSNKAGNIADIEPFPLLDEAALIKRVRDWLTPDAAKNIESLSALNKLDLKSLLYPLLPWQIDQWINTYAPEYFTAPSGRELSINYTALKPQIEIKLQEMFGLNELPRLATGDQIECAMLSPAGRPLAYTKDLPHFWDKVYPDVRKEMRGRYVKHPWPEDPRTASATAKTNAALRRE